MKTIIYGAGSLGTVLGTYLACAGEEVTLVNRNKAHVDALNSRGAHISGTVDMRAKVKAILPEELKGPIDIVLLLTKQLQNAEIISFLKPMLSEKGVIVTFQNGIPEPGIAEIVGENHVLGCVVEWGATMTGPGECILTSAPDSLSFQMGKSGSVPEEMFLAVRTLLEKMCRVDVKENLRGARWSKLLINATFSGIGTAIGGKFGDVSENREVQGLALRCMKECIDVGHAAGITFAPVQGKDITKLFYYRTPVKKTIAKIILPVAMKKHREIEPSMLQDLKHGKPCEIEVINGVVCAFGRKYHVETPVNDRIVEVVKKEQAGELPLSA